MAPTTVHGVGKPVNAVPGLTPRSPVTVVAPVQVTVEEPRTAKLAAAPSDGAVAWAQHSLPIPNRQITNNTIFFILKLLGWIFSSLTMRDQHCQLQSEADASNS